MTPTEQTFNSLKRNFTQEISLELFTYVIVVTLDNPAYLCELGTIWEPMGTTFSLLIPILPESWT